MEANERERSPQELWRLQEGAIIQMTTVELCARAQKHRNEQLLVYRAAWVITSLFLLGFIYDLTELRSAWVIAGLSLAIAAFIGMEWGILWNRPSRLVPPEPCLDYLRLEFKAKRRGLLRIRNCLLLLIPALLATWWGQRPITPAPWILLTICVAFLWYSFSHQARQVGREIAQLERVARQSAPKT